MARGFRLAALLVLGGLTAGAYGESAVPFRQQGLLVELAWIESPITYPCPLHARVTGATLEVRGAVPNGTIREFAINIARKHTTLRVVDQLQIDPGVTGWPESPPDPAVLADRAAAALAKGLGQSAGSYRVTTTHRGDVVVEGKADSLADKVRVSKCLQGVAGCRRVRNRVTLDPSAALAVPEDLVRRGPAAKPLPPIPTPRDQEEVRPTGKTPPTLFIHARPTPPPSPKPVALAGGESQPAEEAPPRIKPWVPKAPTKAATVPSVEQPSPVRPRPERKEPPVKAPRIRIAPQQQSAVPPPQPGDLLRLRQRVAGVCGPWVQNVQVQKGTDGRIHVRVYAYNEGTLGTLRTWITDLPEMQHPDVSLEMKLLQ